MIKLLIAVVVATALAYASGHWIYITQPDGSVTQCYLYDNGNMMCI